MSIVSVVFNKNGVLLMGDTKGTISNGSSKKVIKVMKYANHMFGVTGKVSDIYKFLSPFITTDFTINTKCPVQENQMLDFYDKKFYYFAKNNIELDVRCFVILEDDNTYIIKEYNLIHSNLYKNKCYICKSERFKLYTLGTNGTDKLIIDNFKNIKPGTKNECINLFKTSVTEAMITDDSINNEITYEELGELKK